MFHVVFLPKYFQRKNQECQRILGVGDEILIKVTAQLSSDNTVVADYVILRDFSEGTLSYESNLFHYSGLRSRGM